MNKISILSYDYPPCKGGISRLIASVASEISSRGIIIEILTVKNNDYGPTRPDLPTIEVGRGIYRLIQTWLYLKKLGRNAYLITTVWNPEATVAWLCGNKKLYIMAHGNEVMPYPNRIKFFIKKILRREVLGFASNVICNSYYTEKQVLACQPNAKTIVICPAVDYNHFNRIIDKVSVCEKYGLPHNKKLVLSVARISAYKGHDVILKAFAKLTKEKRRMLQYVVVGTGEFMNELKQMTINYGLEDCVSWLGYVTDDELPDIYRAADLFILCTREDKKSCGVEGFGMVFLEAQASDVPVIGTRAGGIPDAIKEGNGGWFVEQDDYTEICEHLNRLIDDYNIYKSQGILGGQRVKNECSWSGYVDKLLATMGGDSEGEKY
jgi:phosphatidyl-myo-inositol dimannoside synthase